jgi:DNA-binding transcriptional regulator YiaG
VTSGEIKALRARASITQGELAAFLGVSSSAVYKWEQGLTRPNDWQVAMLDAFAEAENHAPGVMKKAVKALYAQGYARALYLILAAAIVETG